MEQRPACSEGVNPAAKHPFIPHTFVVRLLCASYQEDKEPDMVAICGELMIQVVCFKGRAVVLFRK